MLWGYITLFTTDGLLVVAGAWLLRSRRFEGSPPLSLTVPVTLGALMFHVVAYATCQVLLMSSGEIDRSDASGRMQLFITNMVSGSAPAVIFAYALVVSFAHTVSSQVSMMDKEPEPISTDAFRLARSLAAQGRYPEALDDCRKLAARFPESPLPLIEIALVQQRMEAPNEAADTLRTVLRKFPQFEEIRRRASLLLADLLEYSLDDPETAAYLRKRCRKEGAEAIESGTPVAKWVDMDRARHLAKQGEIDRAVACYRELFRGNPNVPRPMLEAATTLEKAGRPEDAVGVLQELARASNTGGEAWAEAMYRLARILDNSLNDPEGGRHALREILRKASGSKTAELAREMLRGESGQMHLP